MAVIDIYNCHWEWYQWVACSKKTDNLFSGMLNVSGIVDETLIVGFDEQGSDHYAILDKVLWVCRQANLILIKDKCLFRCTSIPFFGEVISWQGVSPVPQKVQALTEMAPLKSKEELQSFLVILNLLSKFSPATAEVCEPSKKPDLSEDWLGMVWNGPGPV